MKKILKIEPDTFVHKRYDYIFFDITMKINELVDATNKIIELINDK